MPKWSHFFLVSIMVLIPSWAKEIKSTAIESGETKNQACEKALLQAQKEALEQSGINIFSTYESKQTLNDEKVKKIINTNLQTSYGFVETKSKKEKVNFDPQTGIITCQIEGTFEVDTSKLKSQLLAINQKYDNIYQEEDSKAKALRQKNELLDQYEALKHRASQEHTYSFNGEYNCGDSLGLSECKSQLTTQIKHFARKALAETYDLEHSMVKIGNVALKNSINTTTKEDTLIVSYKGEVATKALSVKNPYIDEINSLNASLGEAQVIEEEERLEQPKGPSFFEKLGESIGNITHNISSRTDKIIYNGHIRLGSPYYVYEDYDESHSNESFAPSIWTMQYFMTLKNKYFLKVAWGKSTLKDILMDFNGRVDTASGYHKEYEYDFLSLGVSALTYNGYDFMVSIDIDYVVPYNVSGFEKNYLYTKNSTYPYDYNETLISETNKAIDPFINLSFNFDYIVADDIILGSGITIGGEEAWKYLWLSFRLGVKF